MKELPKIFNKTAWVYVLITIFVIGTLHLATLNRLLTFEWGKSAFIYCYFIPIVIGTLIWLRRREFASKPARPSWFGLFFVLMGCFFLLLGELGGEFYSLYLSIWFMMLGLCWAQFGWRKLKTILFPLLLLLLTFPPPRFFWVRLVSFVQIISAGIAGKILELLQVPVFRQGDVLNLEYIRFQLTGAYSGLRFLIPIGISALVLVVLLRATLWKRILTLILVVPLAVTMNGLRIAFLSLLANSKQAVTAAGGMNEISGWIMFIMTIGLLYGMIFLLNIRQKIAHGGQGAGQGTAVDRGNPDSNSGISRPKIPFPYVMAVSILVVVFFFLQYRGRTYDHFPQARSFETFPTRIEFWQGQRFFFSPDLIDILDLSDYVQMQYKSPYGNEIDFYVSWYTTQSKGKSIHTPETCLRVGSWRFHDSIAISLNFPAYEDSPIRMNKTVLIHEDTRWIMYFWFRCRGRNLTNAYELKFFNFWDRLIKRRTDGALIRVMTPVSESETSDDAEQRLQHFLNAALPILNTYLPD